MKRANGQKFTSFYRIFKGIQENGVDLKDANARKKISEKWKRELKMDNDEPLTSDIHSEKK